MSIQISKHQVTVTTLAYILPYAYHTLFIHRLNTPYHHTLSINPALWSRRVHALERVADKVPVTNKYCAYDAFTVKPTSRYLFAQV